MDLRKTCVDLLRLALHRFALPGLGQTCFAEICFAWTCSDLLCIDLRKTCAGFALAGSAAGASRQASSGEQFWSSSIVEKTCVGLPKLALLLALSDEQAVENSSGVLQSWRRLA